MHAKVLKEITYMDDICDSVHSLQEAEQLTADFDGVLQQGGFKSNDGFQTRTCEKRNKNREICAWNFYRVQQKRRYREQFETTLKKFSCLTSVNQKKLVNQENDAEPDCLDIRPGQISNYILCSRQNWNAAIMAKGIGMGWRVD